LGLKVVKKKNWVIGLIALTATAGLLAWWLIDGVNPSPLGSGGAAAVAPDSTSRMADDPGVAGGPGGGPFSASGLAVRKQQLAVWQQRYDRAAEVYSSYRDSTRYPHESRPISEHPDQVRPFDPVTEEKTLRDAAGKVVKGLSLRTTQERVFVGGAESVLFTIEAFDEAKKPVALVVTRSSAQTIPDTAAPITIISANVPFSDDGAGADIRAGDGKYSARLTPASQGFANHAGTIRLLAEVSANGQQGVAHFDVVYAPSVPAQWLGTRDALEAGALNFYLKAQVQTAGRYVVTGRIYDANGKPFALLQFNDEVPAGTAEFKLQLFGALVRDKAPAFPLRLVDVDGFLLRPDAFPDRFMMARQVGLVHTTSRYSLDRFSAAEWTSEERERYLNEYGRDMQEALDKVGSLQDP
jgi:hypothetical protein